MGTEMFYDSISSSMDYSNRMTGLMGYAPQTMCCHELRKGMKIPAAASAPEETGAGTASERIGWTVLKYK